MHILCCPCLADWEGPCLSGSCSCHLPSAAKCLSGLVAVQCCLPGGVRILPADGEEHPPPEMYPVVLTGGSSRVAWRLSPCSAVSPCETASACRGGREQHFCRLLGVLRRRPRSSVPDAQGARGAGASLQSRLAILGRRAAYERAFPCRARECSHASALCPAGPSWTHS